MVKIARSILMPERKPYFVRVMVDAPVPANITECNPADCFESKPTLEPGTRIYTVNLDGSLKFIEEECEYE